MCGIHLSICSAKTAAALSDLNPALKQRLWSRGPDHYGRVDSHYQSLHLSFTSTVLSLRGHNITPQPFEHPSLGSVFCWNGEAWKIGGRYVQGNDGAELFALLTSGAIPRPESGDAGLRESCILDVFRSIEGPFAFIFFDKPTGRIYFGRDRLGRRSLVTRLDSDNPGALVLASIAGSSDSTWEEIEADGLYVLDLNCPSSNKTPVHVRHAWASDESDEQYISGFGKFNNTTPSDSEPQPSPLSLGSSAVRSLRERLTESLRLRILNVPEPPLPPGGAAASAAANTRVAVLFSGGLDCTVLARMCHDLLPADHEVDLINVAFENPRVVAQLVKSWPSGNGSHDVDAVYEACPDRMTGRKSFAELIRVCPGRAWRLIAVNVPFAETTAHRPEIVSLIHPHNTEMDLSIAYALYFAARAQGTCHQSKNIADALSNAFSHVKSYSTPARVLLSGLGADELFGGYVRHATAFSRRGYPGLVEEMRLDVSRLGRRNLGRDDRVMSHWGKEVRFAYLDEELVRWAVELPVWEKCDFGSSSATAADDDSNAMVEPGKRVLRLLAEELGLLSVAREKKRAVSLWRRAGNLALLARRMSAADPMGMIAETSADTIRLANRKDGEWEGERDHINILSPQTRLQPGITPLFGSAFSALSAHWRNPLWLAMMTDKTDTSESPGVIMTDRAIMSSAILRF